MAKFVIKTIALLLKNNKFAEFGDIIEDSHFATDVETLKTGGYIASPTKDDFAFAEAKKKGETVEPEKSVDTVKAKKPYKQMTKAELVEELNERKAEFDETATNADLISFLEKDDEDKKAAAEAGKGE